MSDTKSKPQRWEYRREDRMWGEPEKLNQLGGQGWELVVVTDDGTFMFKRPLP